MNQPIDKAYWKDNLDMGGGEYAKTMIADAKRGVALTALDIGVLVKKRGHADRLVPWGNIAAIEAKEGFGEALPPSFSRAFGEGVAKEMAAPPAMLETIAKEPAGSPDVVIHGGEMITKKRSPGRPKGS